MASNQAIESMNMAILAKALVISFCFCFWLVGTSTTYAASKDIQLKLFQTGSMSDIETSQKGKRFVLLLWSIDCPPCMKELEQLSQVKDPKLQKQIILIATDPMEYQTDVKKLISRFQLEAYPQWIVNDPIPERARYQIDPEWYGELPRSYFYEANGSRQAHSGILQLSKVIDWLKPNNQ